MTGLIYRAVGSSCNCQASVVTGKCDCVDRAINNEYYWNGIQCVIAGDYGNPCNDSYECQVLTKFLTCDILTRTCICLNRFYDVLTESCIITTTTTTSTTTSTTPLCIIENPYS